MFVECIINYLHTLWIGSPADDHLPQVFTRHDHPIHLLNFATAAAFEPFDQRIVAAGPDLNNILIPGKAAPTLAPFSPSLNPHPPHTPPPTPPTAGPDR